MTATSAIVTSPALIGHSLAEDKALATLPLAMQFIAVMAITAPASFLMKRIGRRDGFTVGLCIGLVGVFLAIVAIRNSDFVLFCIASFLVGTFNGFGQYYRFAAADTAEDAFKGRAISLVMAGGGWRHGSHINVFKRQKLNSLYLSVLQRLGVKTRKFNTVETSFTGLK